MSNPNDPRPPQDPNLQPPARDQFASPSSLVPANSGGSRPPGVSNSSSQAAVRPEILTAPPKPVDLLRALQRRWLLAAVLGLMLGVPAAIVMFFVVPVEYTAEAFLKFSDTNNLLTNQNDQQKLRKEEDPLQTHIQLILSPLVLNAALAEPGISDIHWLKEVDAEGEDPVAWLRDHLRVSNPRATAILRISMSGDDAEPLKEIVNAVANAYLVKVVSTEREAKLNRVKTLEDEHSRLIEEIRQRRAAYQSLVDQVDAFDGMTAEAHHKFLDGQRIDLQEELSVVRTEIRRIKLELRKTKVQEAPNEEDLEAAVTQQAVDQDVEYVGLMAQIQRLQDEAGEIEKRTKDPIAAPPRNLVRIRGEIDRFQKQADERRAVIAAQIKDQGIRHPIVQKIELLEQHLAATEEHRKELAAEVTTIQKRIDQLTDTSPELQQRKDKLEQLEEVTTEVGLRLEKLLLELAISSDAVMLAQSASTPQMYNSSSRDRLAVMAALGGIGLAVVGVSLYEFQFRRLGSSHDMTEGLGMRVMGDVPMLTERSWRLPGMNGVNAASLQGMMDESVDSIRSLLLHSAGYDSVQVIMVTSANSGEGKTTVASSLAASLGRSGRRTLLIDGDLRRPSVHRVLDLPLDTGLSEVLRGEAAVEEAIRPSRAPGLWVMAAGRCDHESIQSLTKEILGTTLEKLREEFDMIVVDTGPLLSVVDPLLIGQHCDGAIVSVVRRVSQISNVYDTCQRLQNTGIRVLGSVVNGVSGSQISLGYYGYGYGYNDGYGQEHLSEEVAET